MPLNEAEYQCKLKGEKQCDMLVPDLLLTPLRTGSDSLCTKLTRGGYLEGRGRRVGAARSHPWGWEPVLRTALQGDCSHGGSPRLFCVVLDLFSLVIES